MTTSIAIVISGTQELLTYIDLACSVVTYSGKRKNDADVGSYPGCHAAPVTSQFYLYHVPRIWWVATTLGGTH